jgi:hypothetical protein
LRPNQASAQFKTVAQIQDGRTLVEFSNKSPRVFLATQPRVCAKPDEAFDYIFDDKADLLNSPGIETTDALPAGAALLPTESAETTDFSYNRVTVRVHAAQPRMLVLNEMYEKNWTAQVNGEETSVYPANYIFRSVLVPAGESTVVFAYESKAFVRGMRLSGISLCAILGFGMVFWRRQKVLKTANKN